MRWVSFVPIIPVTLVIHGCYMGDVHRRVSGRVSGQAQYEVAGCKMRIEIGGCQRRKESGGWWKSLVISRPWFTGDAGHLAPAAGLPCTPTLLQDCQTQDQDCHTHTIQHHTHTLAHPQDCHSQTDTPQSHTVNVQKIDIRQCAMNPSHQLTLHWTL